MSAPFQPPHSATAPAGHFVVEAGRKVVGLAVRVPGGFEFFSSDSDYRALEGKTFRRGRAIVHRAAQLARSLRPRAAPADGRTSS